MAQVIEKMRLNKFVFVKPKSRRQLYDELRRCGQLRASQFSESSDAPYQDTPANFAEYALSAVDKMSLASELNSQQMAKDTAPVK